MTDFEFKEVDKEGLDTLDVVASADNFNRWMTDVIRPFCKGKVLEIGSGIGNISNYLLEDNYSLTLTDIRDNYCEILSRKFADNQNVDGVFKLDLVDERFDEKYKNYFGTFDTVYALNVIEHIKDDSLAFENCKKLLKAEGHLIILVPAYQWLYNQFDKELYHFKRYSKNRLSKLLMQSKFEIIHKQYFNFIGILGWFFTGSILRKKTIPKSQMGLYNKLVPLFKIVDKILFSRVGLSVIVVGKK